MLKIIYVLLFCVSLSVCNAQIKTSDNDGIIYFSHDNGISWKNSSTGLPQKVSIGLGGITVSANKLGIATKEYGVFLYDFKKQSWDSLPSDKQMIKHTIAPLIFYKDAIFVGTQFGGIYHSGDNGKTWVLKNAGLGNTTIRRFAEINQQLFAATNDGIYVFDEAKNYWDLQFGSNSMQVNGIAEFKESIYIATNQGVFESKKNTKMWTQILPNHSVHNISADSNTLYAMTYTDLLLSSFDGGKTWQKIQLGLPKDLYTFNVEKSKNTVFAGQWDGIYSKTLSSQPWKPSSNGLPIKYAATNLKVFQDILVTSVAERKLK